MPKAPVLVDGVEVALTCPGCGAWPMRETFLALCLICRQYVCRVCREDGCKCERDAA